MSAVQQAAEQRKSLIEDLRSHPSGLAWCARHSELVDGLVSSVYGSVSSQLEEMPPLAVVATGGYGRSELAPYSDVDLTVVPLDEGHPMLDRAVKLLFRGLHDAVVDGLGMKLGYALRHVQDCASLDAKTRSGLIDARFIVGSEDALRALKVAFWATFPVAEFVIEKVAEQRTWNERTNDSPYATQPDLKHGAGGLRSFQCANWIRVALSFGKVPPGADYDHVLLCRNLLHCAAGRAFDVMTHSKRQEISTLIGEGGFEVGARLTGHLIALNDGYCSCLETILSADFPLAPSVSAVHGEAQVLANATVGDAAIGIANATRLGLRVSAAGASPSPVASASKALSALSAGEPTLRNLDRAGVLSVLLPELTACRTVFPRDISHEFTVFEHTLRVVRNLDSLVPDSFLGSVAADLRDKAPLYLAALLHDVGRSESEAGHDEIGAEIAAQVCERWGVYQSTKEDVCWLVREHLSFDRAIRMRDVMNPETAIEFARVVGTPERLAMLALLTWADINAVNAQAWTLTHETFLRELYVRTLAVLTMDQVPSVDSELYRRRLSDQARRLDVSQEEFEGFLDSMPAHYLVSTDSALAHEHFELVQLAKKGEVSTGLKDAPAMGCTEVTVCCADAPGLLSRILGVLYALELSIVTIRASTTNDDEPVALDTITVSFGGRPVPRATATRLARTMKSVLTGDESIEDVMRGAKKDPDLPQKVLTVHFVGGDPAIVEIQAPRGRGMAYRLARQLSAHGINILSARVGQWAGSGTAAFYVSGRDGSRVDEAMVTRALEAQKV
jgi:[protein-PII] uridylyltransferase